MDYTEARRELLENAIYLGGGMTPLSVDLGVSKQYIWAWRTKGLPLKWVIELEKYVANKIAEERLHLDMIEISLESVKY